NPVEPTLWRARARRAACSAMGGKRVAVPKSWKLVLSPKLGTDGMMRRWNAGSELDRTLTKSQLGTATGFPGGRRRVWGAVKVTGAPLLSRSGTLPGWRSTALHARRAARPQSRRYEMHQSPAQRDRRRGKRRSD